MHRFLPAAFLAGMLAIPAAAAPQQVESTATAPFPNFETGPVRPILLSPTGNRLFLLNTPDHRLEIYKLPGFKLVGSIFTGLEPASMVLHPDDPDILFVANHLSDSVSVVNLDEQRVVATIPVGDEPRDLAVVGEELFVSVAAARRLGGASGFDDNLLVVADAVAPYAITDHILLEAHKPRSLVVDGSTVYVIPQNSGNHTVTLGWPEAGQLIGDQTTLDNHDLQHDWELNEALQHQNLDLFGLGYGLGWPIPDTGRIVFDHEFPADVPQLPDRDIVAVDAVTHTVLPQATTGVGTTLLAMERNPVTGQLWVANTDARNRTRMEYNLRGDAVENRITIAAAGGAVQQILALDDQLLSAEQAQPATIAFYEGTEAATAYIASLGSATVVALDAANPLSVIAEIATGEIPSGLAVDSAQALLYVFCRGDKSVRVYDIAGGHNEIYRLAGPAYDPEPPALVTGRKHHYEARAAGGHGTGNFSCNTCHVFGNHDMLAWDLGDSAGSLNYYYPDLLTGTQSFAGPVTSQDSGVNNPMKGPMVTQSLRGMAEGAPLHWRGDRRFFHMFQGAFKGLLGGQGITAREMQEYTTFIQTIKFPPNPFQPKNRQYVGQAENGRIKFGVNATGKVYNFGITQPLRCTDCHFGDFANRSEFTGGSPTALFDGDFQPFNTPTLRGIYEKNFRSITGFGTSHDGKFENIRGFMDIILNVGGLPGFVLLSNLDRNEITVFVKQWDTGMAPVIGDQFTVTQTNLNEATPFLDLVEAQASALDPPDADLVLHGSVLRANGSWEPVGAWYSFDPVRQEWRYRLDDGRTASRSGLLKLAASGKASFTFTAVPPGLGQRLGIDRDEDGLLNGRELRLLGTNPDSPDTDFDGFDDRLELQIGSDPRVFDASIQDQTAPVLDAASFEIQELFSHSATFAVMASEPARLLVEVGPSAGSYPFSASSNGLRRQHQIVLADLPAGKKLFYRMTATDNSSNTSSAMEGEFTTPPPIFHVEEVDLQKSGSGPFDLTATVKIVDTNGSPIKGIEVHGIWYSDANDLQAFTWDPMAKTNAAGVATFHIGSYNPSGTSKISFTPAWIGSQNAADPYYVGSGGGQSSFFYFQPDNKENFASLSVP